MQLDKIADSVIRGDAEAVARLTREALDAGIPPDLVLERGLIAGMGIIGVRFKNNEIFVPEVLIAARAMKAGMQHLEPLLMACGIQPVGKCVIGTVKGDIHDIGKNLVAMMLKGAGIEVIDLGVNVPASGFIEAIRTHQPNIVGMSALLTTTMIQMKYNIEAFRKEGLLESIKVMVGIIHPSDGFSRLREKEGIMDQDKLRAALNRLNGLMSEVVRMIEETSAIRCPYRSAEDECTFMGWCQNQMRSARQQVKCIGAELHHE